jgi:hypothetical protein
MDYVKKRDKSIGKFDQLRHSNKIQKPAFSILPPVESR